PLQQRLGTDRNGANERPVVREQDVEGRRGRQRDHIDRQDSGLRVVPARTTAFERSRNAPGSAATRRALRASKICGRSIGAIGEASPWAISLESSIVRPAKTASKALNTRSSISARYAMAGHSYLAAALA